MSDQESFKLDELAQAAGTSARTVRYYVQRGLLPAPEFRGKDTAYSREHLVRLRAIRRLQERFLPLDAIQVELARLPPAELERVASGGLVIDAPSVLPLPPPPASTPPALPRATRWTRRELLPGLELTLADDASPEARELADEIRMFHESLIRQRGARR